MMETATRAGSDTSSARALARSFFAWVLHNRAIATGMMILLTMVLAGEFLPLPYSPIRPSTAIASLPPSSAHWFGTDAFGFDIFSRTVDAASRDIPLAALGSALSLAIGVPLGLLASTKGRSSEIIMRGVDAFQSFPLLIMAIAAVTLLGNRLENVVAAIAIINVPRFMRLIRSEGLSIRESRYIEAAYAIGANKPRIMFVHLLPNVVGVILVQTSLAGAHALVIITTLSYLGVGVSPPHPTWGAMIQTGARVLTQGHWWVLFFPAAAIFVAVMSFNLIADGIQRALDRQEHA